MLALNESSRYYLYKHPTDMRKSFDGLSGLVRQQMQANVLSGDVFIFINKRRNQLKLLKWDSDGFVVYHKRLERGTFELPDTAGDKPSISIGTLQLQLILSGIELRSIKRRTRYVRTA